MKIWRGAVCVGILVVGVLSTRTWISGRDALVEGDAAYARNDRATAVFWWSRAARWYLPGAPYVNAAYDRLETARAFAEVRSSILATRTFWTPFPERLARADRELGLSGETVKAPSSAWTLLAGFGFCLWIAGAVAFAYNGTNADGRVKLRTAIRCGACVASGLLLWILGLYQA